MIFKVKLEIYMHDARSLSYIGRLEDTQLLQELITTAEKPVKECDKWDWKFLNGMHSFTFSFGDNL